MKATAVIAEDEPLLAQALRAALQQQWPDLQIVADVRDGTLALDHTLALRPDVVFLDIRMPGLDGLAVAQAIAEDWPGDRTLPLIVFVTAYDQCALSAFDRAAVDYLLKPIRIDRLAQTCTRLQTRLQQRAVAAPATATDETLAQLRALLDTHGVAVPVVAAAATTPLTTLQAGVGNTIHFVPVVEVVYFEAADKYVRVVTRERDLLIRMSLRELLQRLDGERFWQVHRGVVVCADAIASAQRDAAGKVQLRLRGHRDTLVVSRLYAHRFKPM